MESFNYDIPSASNAGAARPLNNFPNGFTNYTNIPSTSNASRRVSTSTSNAGAARPLVNLAVLEDQVKRIKRLAKIQRKAAVVLPAKQMWSGKFHRQTKPLPDYSLKVFVGGMPWNVPEGELMQIFSKFGQCRIEWPKSGPIGAGHIHVVYSRASEVRMLLRRCEKINGDFFFDIRTRTVQVIPFDKNDRFYLANEVPQAQLAVFVGNLRGSITAEDLKIVMTESFGEVDAVVFDVDAYDYPTGSARVVFHIRQGFVNAINTAVLLIDAGSFCRSVQIDPYIGYSVCSICFQEWGFIFCRSVRCFRYFCLGCWIMVHVNISDEDLHLPMILQSKGKNNM